MKTKTKTKTKSKKAIESIKCLPTEGMISVSELAKFLGMKSGALKRRLLSKGIPTINLGTHSNLRLLDLKELKSLLYTL